MCLFVSLQDLFKAAIVSVAKKYLSRKSLPSGDSRLAVVYFFKGLKKQSREEDRSSLNRARVRN